MESACNLECIFKLLFQEYSRRNADQIISLIDSRLRIAELDGNGCEASSNLKEILTSIELLLKIFNSNYEPRFNVFIEYIFDQVRNILEFGIGSNVLSTLPLTSVISVVDAILDISISHKCKGSATKLARFYTDTLNALKSDHSSLSEEELIFRLRIASVFYEVVNKKEAGSQTKDFKQLIANLNEENDDCDLFAKLVFNHSKVVSAQTLINVTPAYIKFSGTNNILRFIWNRLSQSLDERNCEHSQVFVVLCYLSDFYFGADNKKLVRDICECNNYWILLQKGLLHPDTCVRKQALFLLKKTCHYLKEHEIHLRCHDVAVNDSSRTESCELLLRCDSSAIFDALTELWCIIEYLEEKQLHLLKPMIDVIDSFMVANGKKLHVSWLLIIIQRMISHDNVTIIKKGFLNMLNIPISSYPNDEVLTDAVKILVSTLNCTQLYSNHWQEVVDELKIYFAACAKEEKGRQFFILLLHEISSVRWSPEALFFLTYPLQVVEPKHYWGRDELDLTMKISNGTVNHYTYIRSAIQGRLLNTAINFLVSDVTLDDIAVLVTSFAGRTCLTRKSALWEKIVNWTKDSYETEDVEKYLKKSIVDYGSSVDIGKMVLIFWDSYSGDGEMSQKMTNLLKNVLSTFADVQLRPYFDAKAQEFYLSIISSVMDGSCGDCELLKIFSPLLPDIVKYIEIKLDSVHHIRDFERSQSLLWTLDTVFKFAKSDRATLEVASNWFERIVKNLNLEPVKLSPLQKFVHIKTLTVMLSNNSSFESHPKMEYIGQFLRKDLCTPLEKTSKDLTLTEDLQKLWGRMNSEYLKRKWELLPRVVHSPAEVLHASNGDFLRLCFEAMDTGGSSVLLPLMSALGKALPSLLSEPRLRQLMDGVLNVMMERRKNDDFYQLVQSYIDVTFRSDIIETEEESIREMLLEHSRQLFSESNVNVANMFLTRVQSLEFRPQNGYFFADLLPRALLFGQIRRKDERLLSSICAVVERENLSPLTNDFSTNVEVRAKAVQMVVSLDGRNEEHRRFAEDLTDAVIKYEENVNRNKSRYYADSHVHRYKERMMQSLLVLEGYLSKEKCEALWKWLCNKIVTENNQPSVRYLQEWLMLRLIYRNSHLKDELWKYFDEGTEKRTGSLCSLITIVYHSVKCIPEAEMETWIENAVQKFLPYCMAQHFSVRLYAQVTLQKLMTLTKELNLTAILEKYGVVTDILERSIKSGNAIKNCAKMREDFYFTVFDPVEHFTLETIFYEFLRLTSAGSQDLIPPSLFERCGVDETHCSVPVRNKNESLRDFTCGKWIVDGSNQTDLLEDSEESKEIELSNLQKKMIPIKYLIPDADELLQFVSHKPDDRTDRDGLVVVGSLIDRLPNLGGLTRTCEVFGASEFVIASLKYLEDQQFKSLSVTAEKWIPITEVKPYHLTDYLVKMKKNGYTILAAEQTVNSQPLGSVKFPKKSVLLLGNEKEGIPPTLLPLTDVCVEIPQKGVIRSLNVHVTGALFIWEYAKQHNDFAKS